HRGKVRVFQFAPSVRRNLVTSEIKFVALRVDDNARAAKHFFRVRLAGQTFDAADAGDLGAAGQLPALGQRDGGANAGVGTGAKSNGQAIDFLAFPAGGAQHFVHQSERVTFARSSLVRLRAQLTIGDHRDAPSVGGEFKGQNLHTRCVAPVRSKLPD